MNSINFPQIYVKLAAAFLDVHFAIPPKSELESKTIEKGETPREMDDLEINVQIARRRFVWSFTARQ